jgi:hypothetical protein
MGFPHIFYTADKPCQGNYVNNTDLFSCHGDKSGNLISEALVQNLRTSFPIRMKFPSRPNPFGVLLMSRIHLMVTPSTIDRARFRICCSTSATSSDYSSDQAETGCFRPFQDRLGGGSVAATIQFTIKVPAMTVTSASPEIKIELHQSPVSDADRIQALETPGFGKVFTDHMVLARCEGYAQAAAGARSRERRAALCSGNLRGHESLQGRRWPDSALSA